MNTASAQTKLNIPVRWPFRALAGVILMTGLMAVAGSAYIDWTHGTAPADVRLHLLLLPGALWLTRLAWHALIEGRSPEAVCWPFASEQVARCYFVVLFLAFNV